MANWVFLKTLKAIKKINVNFFAFSAIWIFLLFMLSAKAEISFGNFRGNVVLVEYFSYNCPICRSYIPLINYIAKKNPNLEVVQRVVPVAIPSLQVVDRAVLASFLQNKFPQFQRAILETRIQGAVSPQLAFMLARNVGINMEQLKKDMVKPVITKQLRNNLHNFLKIYSKIHQMRVPVFVFYNKNNPSKKVLMVGVQPLEKLQSAINSLSKNFTKKLTKKVTKSTKGDHYHASYYARKV